MIGHSVDGDAAVRIIDFIQKKSVLHAIFRMTEDLLTFQLEKNYGDGLMHPGGEKLVLFRIVRGIISGEFHGEAGYIAVFIDFVGKHRERTQGDAVTGFDHFQVVVVDGVGEHRCNQCAAAGGGTHPEYIVVAPLDIYAVIVQQRIHDNVGAGPAVEDISDQVQVVYRHPLDHLSPRGDKVRRLTDLHNGGNDVFIVILLVKLITVCMKQLFDDIGVIRRQSLANLGAGIAGADRTAELHKPVECDTVPLIQIFNLWFQLFQLLLRVIDQRGQLLQLRMGNAVFEQKIQLLPDDTRAGVEDMQESFMLTVDIGDEVLTAFRQIQNGLKIDDFSAGGTERRILMGEHPQVAQFLWGVALMLLDHSSFSLYSGRLYRLPSVVSLPAEDGEGSELR